MGTLTPAIKFSSNPAGKYLLGAIGPVRRLLVPHDPDDTPETGCVLRVRFRPPSGLAPVKKTLSPPLRQRDARKAAAAATFAFAATAVFFPLGVNVAQHFGD